MKRERLLLELRRSLRPLVAYALLLAVGVTAFALIFKNLNFVRPWKHYDEVRVSFDDVKGVFPGGHQVRISGVKVGVVDKASLVDGRAVLTLKIEHKYGHIYRDAKIRIRPVTPLQDLYVNVVDRGHKAAGVANKSYIIPAKQTVTPVDISRVLDSFDGDARRHLGVLLDELGKGMGDGGGERLREAFAQLTPFLGVARDATTVMARRRQNLRRLVHNFGTLSGTLAKRDRELTRLVRAGTASLATVADNARPFDATLAELPPLVATMRTSFHSLRGLSGELDPALQSLRPVAAALPQGLDGLGRFGRDALPALTALRPALRNLRAMSTTLAPTSRALRAAFSGLRDQSPQYDTLTAQLPPCFKSMTDFFANTLSVFKFEDANGAFPRAETTVDADSSNVVKGINTRRLPSCIDQIK